MRTLPLACAVSICLLHSAGPAQLESLSPNQPPPTYVRVSAESNPDVPSSDYLFEGNDECRKYFDAWAEKAGDVETPGWVRVLSPDRPTIELLSYEPIQYINPKTGNPTNAAILLQAAPGYLFKKFEMWAQVDIREEPENRHAYFIYLSHYNPHDRFHHEASLVYEKPGPQELNDSWELENPWPMAHARLFTSSKTKRIYKWQITAHFVEGTAADAMKKFYTERAATIDGKVHIYGTPTGTKLGIDGPPHSSQSFATDLKPGNHTALFSHPDWGERKVMFNILPGINSQVGMSLDNGWACYGLPSIPRDVGVPALTALPGGGYLVVASRKVDGRSLLHAWYSTDLAEWTGGKPLPVNVQGAENLLPALCASSDGGAALVWFAGEGAGAQLISATTVDGKQWKGPSPLPVFRYAPDVSSAPSISSVGGDFMIVAGAQALRGRPDAWGEWGDVVLEENVAETITAPDVLETRGGGLVMAFSGKAFHPKEPYSFPFTSVFVATSATGEKWSTPIEIAHGTRPHLFESGKNVWMILRGRNYLEAWYSRDGGRKWFGPSTLTPLFDSFEQGDVVPVGGGRFAAVNGKREGFEGGYLVSLHLGSNFPDYIPSVESQAYRWEDFDRASNAHFLQNTGEFIWSISPYTGYGRLTKSTGAFDRERSLKTADLPDLSGNTIGALTVEGDRVWIGANGAGVYCLSQSQNKMLFGAEAGKSIRFDIITAIAPGPAFVYVGTPIGLEVFNREDGFWMDFDHVEELKGLPITALASTIEYLWIGTRDGRALKFNQIDKVEEPIEWPEGEKPSKIVRLFADGPCLWVVAKNGVWQFDGNEEPATCLLSSGVDDACLDGETLWVAGNNRLRTINATTGRVSDVVINSDKYKEPISSTVWSVATDDQYVYASIYGGVTRGLKTEIETK